MSLSAEVIAEFERANSGPITVDITTTGRSSGDPKRIEIWIVKVGERLVIGGTPAHRDWMSNLRADGRLVVHLKDRFVADVEMTATEVTDPQVRREIWEHGSTSWYRDRASVEELVASAPTVELRPG